ncbi:histidinol-phosphatase [Helicobacter fennelliae]|uniref:histidinol-phosphatase n=1 Tax=Helicobacter fennelliae TaxID=215 RepID=UPI000DFF7D09|nr:histidinol-phosphatase [Helicobacter fennelliae]STQ83737.1 histidinol-phosphatase [Helicobacter fennelliae]
MRIDLHNHTPLCNHATGTPEQYLKAAKNLGIDVYGFACHAPMDFDTQYRMKKQDVPMYLEELCALKHKYQNDIEVLSGFEVDFITQKEFLMESCVLEADVDYLIGSVHFLGNWGFDNPEFIGEYAKKDMHKCWILYLQSIQKMAQTGLFQIVGHLDLLKIFGYTMPSTLESELEHTLIAIKEANMAIEINTSGLRKAINELYPSSKILAFAYKMQIPITFGSDAHSIEHVGFGYQTALQTAFDIGYKSCVIYRKKEPITIEIA